MIAKKEKTVNLGNALDTRSIRFSQVVLGCDDFGFLDKDYSLFRIHSTNHTERGRISALLRKIASCRDGSRENFKEGRFIDWPTSENPQSVHQCLQAMMSMTMLNATASVMFLTMDRIIFPPGFGRFLYRSTGRIGVQAPTWDNLDSMCNDASVFITTPRI